MPDNTILLQITLVTLIGLLGYLGNQYNRKLEKLIDRIDSIVKNIVTQNSDIKYLDKRVTELEKRNAH